MKKLRSVNTKFWNDPFIETINPSEKLLFLYFLTNPLTNVLGIYEITMKRIIFDTGLDRKTILKALKGFEEVGKVYYVDNHIILASFLKNQSMNDNMKKGAMNAWHELSEKIRQLSDYKGEVEDFGSLLKALEAFGNSNVNLNLNLKGNGKENDKVAEIIRKNEDEGINTFSSFINEMNKLTNKSFKGDKKSKTQFNARIKEGWTLEQILTAVKHCKADKFHQENPHYLTPEFITRSDKLEKYYHAGKQESKPRRIKVTEGPTDRLDPKYMM